MTTEQASQEQQKVLASIFADIDVIKSAIFMLEEFKNRSVLKIEDLTAFMNLCNNFVKRYTVAPEQTEEMKSEEIDQTEETE